MNSDLELRLSWNPDKHSIEVGPDNGHTLDMLRLGDDEYNTLKDCLQLLRDKYLNEAFYPGRERALATYLQYELNKLWRCVNDGRQWYVRPVT